MSANHSRIWDLYLTGKGIQTYHQLLKHSQYWSEEKIKEFQVQQMQNILRHAFENIPFYRKRFMECAFNPYRDFQDIGDIKRIPVLRQSEARNAKEQLAYNPELRNSIELRTSGTTGEPFICYASPKHWIVEQGVLWRHWKWMGYKFRDRMAIIRSYVPQKGAPLWKIDKARNFYYLSAYHISEENVDPYIRKLREWKPKFLRGYPSSLYLLAQFMKARSLSIDAPIAIITASETLLPHYRKLIEETFNAPVFNWYGMAEPAITMVECDAHTGMHVNAEYGLCELLEDRDLPSNERRIVATSLHNTAMPLIRYETKDIAVMMEGGKCSCGRSLPVVKTILGRSDDFLYGSKGRILPSVNFYTLFYEYPEYLRFQIIQKSKREIEVRVSFSGSVMPERRMQFLDEFRDRVGSDVMINMVENEAFIQTGEGKTPVIIQKVKESPV
jgi:phenylacetate-CoA ligase